MLKICFWRNIMISNKEKNTIIKKNENLLISDNNNDFYKKLNILRNKIYGNYDKDFLNKKTKLDDSISDGVFSYEIDGVLFHCCFHDGGNSNLYVTFTGANTQNPEKIRIPNFPRWSYYSFFDGSFLGIDDPMFYKFKNIKIGWYYGDKNRSYLKDSLSIIDKICNIKNISKDNVIFFSSSGGGYASIYIASLIKNALSISINPQIYINNHHYTNDFEENTHISLNEIDRFNRNNLYECITNNESSRHVIVVNAHSSEDWENHIIPLANKFSINLRYGLNHFKNILIWIYDAVGCPYAHTSFETRYIFIAIDYIAKQFKYLGDRFDVDQYQDIALLINEQWHDLYEIKKIYSNKQDIIIPCDIQSFSNKIVVQDFELQKCDSECKHYAYRNFEKNTKYIIIFKCSNTDTDKSIQEFTAGLFDYKSSKIIKYNTYRINVENSFVFYCGENISGIGFCLYAGIFRKTKGHSLKIDYIKISQCI